MNKIYIEQEFLNNLSSEDKNIVLSKLLNSLNNYQYDFYLINDSMSVINRTDSNYKNFVNCYIELLKKEIQEIDFSSDYENNIENIANEYLDVNETLYNLNEIGIKIFKNYNNIIINEFRRIFFSYYITSNNSLKNVHIDYLELIHILVASEFKIDLTYTKISNKINNFINKFDGINITKVTNEEITNKVYFDFNETKKIKVNSNCFIDLKLLYIDNEYFMPVNTLIDILKRIKISNQSIIRLPLFLISNSTIFNSSNHGYFRIYYEFTKYYNHLIQSILLLPNITNDYIVISDVMKLNDYLLWNSKVRSLSNVKLKIGIVLEDYDFLYAIDYDYETILSFFDTVVIQIDHLINNQIGSQEIDLELFKLEVLDELRLLKNQLINAKIPSIIYMKKLKTEELIEKLIKMGFNNYIISRQNSDEMADSYLNYMSRRGKFTKKQLL